MTRWMMACLTLLGVCVSATAGAQPTPNAWVVSVDATFLRAEPRVSGGIVTRLERGERVDLLERTDGEWWHVRVSRLAVDGYLHRGVLKDAASVPEQPTSAAPPRERPTPVVAQEPLPAAQDDARARPVASRRTVGALATAGIGVFRPAAHDTFDAVGITDTVRMPSAGVEVVRVWRGLFMGVDVSRMRETGERVFLDGGNRYPMGIPLDIEVMPIDVTAGWRFESAQARTRQPVVPFVGGGFGVTRYKESDPFAEGSELIDERFTSYHARVGADVYLWRWLGVRAEYRYRHVPDALGKGGVSEITGDTSLGGSTLLVGVVVGR